MSLLNSTNDTFATSTASSSSLQSPSFHANPTPTHPAPQERSGKRVTLAFDSIKGGSGVGFGSHDDFERNAHTALLGADRLSETQESHNPKFNPLKVPSLSLLTPLSEPTKTPSMTIPLLNIPRKSEDEDGRPLPSPRFGEPLKSARHQTPVAATTSLVNEIGQKFRAGSQGVRGRSTTSNSEHIATAVAGHKKAHQAKRHVYLIVSILPIYFIAVALLRLNLLSTLYIVAFLVSATTHPYLTGVAPEDFASRSQLAVYGAGGVAAVSLLGQVVGQIVVQFYSILYEQTWVELVGWCNFQGVGIMERVQCTLPEAILVCAALYLKVMERRAESVLRVELGGSVKALSHVGVIRGGTASKICSFSTVAVFSGMSAASHPALLDLPFLLIFIVYCVAWSRNVDIEHSMLARGSFITAFRSYCALVYTVHYATFVPYLAKHIPNTIIFKVIGLTWLHDLHGEKHDKGEGHKWEAVELQAGNVIHIVFLSMLFLLLCAYSYSKTKGKKKKGAVMDVDMTHTGSMDVVDLTLQGMVSIINFTETLKEMRPSELRAKFQGTQFRQMASRAEKKSGKAVFRVLTLLHLHGHRYSSRILVALIAAVIVLQPSVMTSIWLLVFLLSLLRRYVFFSVLTPVLMLAVVHILGVWTVAVSNISSEDSGVSNTTLRRLEIAGLAASTCGGIESENCQLILLPILGLLLASVSLTTKLWSRKKKHMATVTAPYGNSLSEAHPDSVVDKLRLIMRKSFIAVMLFWMYFTACWTVDGAHAVLFVLSLVFFFEPKWAEKCWYFVLAYICLLLTVIYLFKVLETDFVPSLANVKDIGRDVVGFHERETWQFFPLFVLFFFAIKQRDLFLDKEKKRMLAQEIEDLEYMRMQTPRGEPTTTTTLRLGRSGVNDFDREVVSTQSRSASSSVLTSSSATTSSSTSVRQRRNQAQMKFRVFVFIATKTGLRVLVVLDLAALASILCLILIGDPTVLSVILLILFLLLSVMSFTPFWNNFSDVSRRRAWVVCRTHLTFSLCVQYFFQYHLVHDKMLELFNGPFQVSAAQFGVERYSVYDGGSLRCFKGLSLAALCLVLAQVQVKAADGVHDIHLSPKDILRRSRVTKTAKRLLASYCGVFMSIALFVAATMSNSHFRSSVMSIPYAVFLCVYMFAPAFGFSKVIWLQVVFGAYATLAMVLTCFYQFPFVHDNLDSAIGASVSAYIGLRKDTMLSLVWTHLFVFMMSLLNMTVFEWERSVGGVVHEKREKPPLAPPAEGATARAKTRYFFRWGWNVVKKTVFEVGHDPKALADRYAFHFVLFAFLLGVVAQPDTLRSWVLLILMSVTYGIGEAGMSLPIVGSLERWFLVAVFVWLLLMYQYFTYLGLPPDFEEELPEDPSHRLPYNVSHLGDYRYFLAVDVTQWELAIDVFVAVACISLWGVYKRRREAGRDPVEAFHSQPESCTEFLVNNKAQLAKARQSIWALYGSGVVPERVPYPLGDLHDIASKAKLPVPGCGCEACETGTALVRPEEDFTPSATHRRTPGEELRFVVAMVLPYITMTLMFVDGATGLPMGFADLCKVILSLVFFQAGASQVKWQGARHCRWIISIYTLFLFTSCLLYFPYIQQNGSDNLTRHLGVKNYFLHALVMVSAYCMELMVNSRSWVWVLYYDQQKDIRSRDIGEKIQQEWLWELDEKKRASVRESERRRQKLTAVKLGHSSTEIMICPVCARKANDELCDDCGIDIEETAEKASLSQGKPSIVPAPSTQLSALEERLMQEGFIERGEYSALEATTAKSEASSDGSAAVPLTLAEAGWSFQRGTSFGSPSETTRPHSVQEMGSQSVSTITLKGKEGGKEQKFIVGKKPRGDVQSAQDEFTSLPCGHHINRFVDAATCFLKQNSLGYPTPKQRRYPALSSAVLWFFRSHTDKMCYVMFFANFISNPCLLSIPLPLSVVMYAMLVYPRPHKKYWLYSSLYISAVIAIKCLCYSLLGTTNEVIQESTSSEDLDSRVTSGFADMQIAFPFLFGTIADFFPAVALELLSLLVIIVHKQNTRGLGLWGDFALYYKYHQETQPDVAGGIPVTVTMLNVEEVIEDDLMVLPEAEVEFCLSGGMLLKSTDKMEPRVVTHLTYSEDEYTIRDQDGCGGKVPRADLGWVLRDIGRLAEIAEIETDIPLAGGASTAAAKSATLPSELNWGPYYFLTHNIFDANGLKTGHDYYLLMFCLDFAGFIMFMFSYYSIQSDRADSDLAASLSANMLPGPLVLAQLFLLIIIIIDRVIYLYKNLIAKFVFQLMLSVLYFVLYSEWNAARLTQEVETGSNQIITSFATGKDVVAALFAVKMLYLVVSAQQIRGGYLELSSYFSLKERHHPIFYGIYMIFRSVPFVYELKIVIDWTFTATTLKFMWWIKLQDITHELYVARCDLEDTRLLKMERDKTLAFPTYRKALQGCGIAALLVCIIFFPLMYYSSFSPALTENYVEHVRVSTGVIGAPPIYSGREALPETKRRLLDSDVMQKIQYTRPSLFGFTYKGRELQLIEMPVGSQMVWWVPHEAKSRIEEKLFDVQEARDQIRPYDRDGDNHLSLAEVRSIEPFSGPLGPETCPPKGQECDPTPCTSSAPTDTCCKGMALWKKLTASNDSAIETLSLDDEAGMAELYALGAYNMQHNVEMSLDLEVTRAAASDASLLLLQSLVSYTLPPAARVSLFRGLSSNLSSETLLPNFYSPFLFNRRDTIALYEPTESTKLSCKLILDPGRNDNDVSVASFSAQLQCEALFEKGNPLEDEFSYSSEEWKCFNMSKYYRWSRCPNYDARTSCSRYEERTLYFISASDTVAKDSGLGSLLASFSVVTLYTTFVLTIGQLIRFFFKGSAYRVVLEDMQDPRPVEYLVTCMHYARCEGDLVLEESLYQELLRLYRSPESLREFTRRDVV